MKANLNRFGVTLVELLIVISIIAFMTMIALPKVSSFSEGGYVRSAQSTLQSIKTEQKIYYLKNDEFATSMTQLGIKDPSDDIYSYEVTTDSSNQLVIKATRLSGQFEDGEIFLPVSGGEGFIINDYGRFGDEIEED